MATRLRSFSKVNLGLAIGPPRPDGFHALLTLYQTLDLHDVVTVSARLLPAGEPARITLTTRHPWVPTDARNTAWRMVERALERMNVTAEVAIDLEKNLPVQGGMGAGSANAAAALLALEQELGMTLPAGERLALAAEIGSDVPLFLLGGAVLGTGRGEQVQPVADLPATHCVIAVPGVGVSTPRAFRDLDTSRLTSPTPRDSITELSRAYASAFPVPDESPVQPSPRKPGTSGIVHDPNSAKQQDADDSQTGSVDDLAENTLLALVRTGIENDFEEVVFSQYPSLREIKRFLMGSDSGAPALYAALSGSGSALFGLYRSAADAEAAQRRVQAHGVQAIATETLPRERYWKRMVAG